MNTITTPKMTASRLLTFPEAVKAQANRTPDAPAIVSGDETITYRELRIRMNRVANFLLRQGIKRESRVGVYSKHGEEVIETLPLVLGALMVAVYVPLDAAPDFPPDRLASMMLEAGVDLVLTHSRDAATLDRAIKRAGRPISVVCVDEDEIHQEVERAGDERPPDEALTREEDMAYILFTSGTSAGKPKGVKVGHRSLAHFSQTLNQWLGILPGDRASVFFAPTFDASFFDLCQLAAGATLYPLPPDALLGGRALLRFLRESAINATCVVPSVWTSLPSYDLPDLRILTVGGEVCPASLVQQTAREGLRICNAWGLTETTVVASIGECENDGRPPSIGKALPEVEVTIRDERLRRVPPGVEGQICVSGACLALGYTDETLTAQRFVRDPESQDSILFLTFDGGKMDKSGTIQFTGRLDGARRLKLSGKQVNLDETEGQLLQEPGVAECAVDHFDGRIIAYVSLHPEATSSLTGGPLAERERREREIRERLDLYLRQRLPAYMRPKGYALLARLPRTSNGKLDRKELRDQVPVTWLLQDNTTDFVQASTAVEQALAQIIAGYLTADRQDEARAQAEAQRVLDREDDRESQQNLPVVSWQEINVARSPAELDIDSGRAPEYILDVASWLGVEIENREIFCPLVTTASAIEFQLEQRAADGRTPQEGA